MSKIVQVITAKITDDHDHEKALEGVKKVKTLLAPHGVAVRAHMAIEAGPASGYVTVTFEFDSAAKWAEFVDSDKESLREVRTKMLKGHIVSTSLMQEVEL